MEKKKYNLVIKYLNNEYFLFPQSEEQDIFIEGQVVRITISGQASRGKQLINSLGGSEGAVRVNGHRKQITFSNLLRKEGSYKLDNCGYEFGYWLTDIYEEHYNLLLKTFERDLKNGLEKELTQAEKELKAVNKRLDQDEPKAGQVMIGFINKKAKEAHDKDFTASWQLEDKIKGLREQLLGLYQHELDAEKRYWKNNQIYITNPYHVEDLKNRVKELKGEMK